MLRLGEMERLINESLLRLNGSRHECVGKAELTRVSATSPLVSHYKSAIMIIMIIVIIMIIIQLLLLLLFIF